LAWIGNTSIGRQQDGEAPECPRRKYDERTARLALGAMRLAPDLLTCKLLMQGIPVARHRLVAEVLEEIGEPLEGPPLQLDERLALRVEAMRRIDPALVSSPIGIERAGIENQDPGVAPVERGSPGAATDRVLPFQSLATLVEKAPEEPEWNWRFYLALYVLALLAGRPKVGKSTLVMALLKAALRGEAFLGLEAKARGVLLLTEERRDTLAEKARILGLMDAEVQVYVLARGDVRDTPWPEVVRQAMTFCSEHGIDVLVVDTLDRWTGIRGEAENAAGVVNEAMEPLQYAAAAGLAVLAVSHQRKSGGEYGEAVRGSNAFTGAVDVVVELERPARSLQLGSQARVLRSVSRFSSTPDELFFELGEDGFVPISDVAEKKSDAERAQVLDALERHDEPVSVDVLAGEVEFGTRTLRRRLTELRGRALVARRGAGKKGDPYLWVVVKDENENAAEGGREEAHDA
jgi:AAA domain